MKILHRYLAIIVAALLLASAASAEIVEVNQRTHKARVMDNFEVLTGDGSYARVNFTVSMRKDWLKKLSTYYLPRLEIIDKGMPASSIPVQRRDNMDGSQYLNFELAPGLLPRCVLVFVEMTSETTKIEYRVDLYSYTKEGAKKRRPLLDELVKVEFPENGYQYTLAEVAKGVKIEYKIVIDEDVPGVTPMRFGPSFVEPAGPSGLYAREAIFGNGNGYCIFDSGLGHPPKEPVKTLKKGTYVHSFEWDGRNWSGPSDTGMPKGKAFPAGTYDLTVVFQGRRETDIGQVPYEITRKAKLVLKAGDQNKPVQPKNDDAWVKSTDGKLSLRLRIKETKIQPTGAVELHATLKNVSDKTIHVIKPFGDWYRARAAHLNIRGPLGMLMYAGDTPDYVIGTAAFVHVKPGESIEHSIKMTLDTYHGFDLPGEYSIHYEYTYAGEWNQTHKLTPAPWEGKIRSQPVKIEILKTEDNDWTLSDDKVVGLQLSGDIDPTSKTQPVVLKATIRNFSFKPITVPKPLGGPFSGMPQGLDVRGPKGVVKYTGPAVNPRHWEGSDFVALSPGQKHEIHFKLDPNLFAGGDTPGKYTIKFDYETMSYQAIAKDLGLANYWSGRMPRVTFVYDHPKDAKRELPLPNEVLNAGLNPKDPRILALVAYLDKNGMKLVHNGTSGYWNITKPAPPDGAFVVSIRTFPDDASEKQMRMVTGGGRRLPNDPIGINLAYKLNAPARIAMSYVSGAGTTKTTKEDFAAVEEKLDRLFKAYRPAAHSTNRTLRLQ